MPILVHGVMYLSTAMHGSNYGDDVNYKRNIGRWKHGVTFVAPSEDSVPGATPMEQRAAL